MLNMGALRVTPARARLESAATIQDKTYYERLGIVHHIDAEAEVGAIGDAISVALNGMGAGHGA